MAFDKVCTLYYAPCSGYQINVVLWGDRATAFDAEEVLAIGQTGPVFVLFVGTLVKTYEGLFFSNFDKRCHVCLTFHASCNMCSCPTCRSKGG